MMRSVEVPAVDLYSIGASGHASGNGTMSGADRQPTDFATLDMTLLSAGQHPAPKLPIEVFGTAWGGWIADSAEGSGAPADYIAMPLISATSAIIGAKKSAAAWPSWIEPSAIWTANIGRPSAGKTPALRCVASLLNGLEKEIGEDYPDTLATYERDKQRARAVREKWQDDVKASVKDERPAPDLPDDAVEPAKPKRPRLILNDATTEEVCSIMAGNPHCPMLIRDEMTGWIGSMGRYSGGENADRPFWLEAYNGSRYVVDRVKNQGDPLVIEHLLIAVCGGVQPDKLQEILSGAEDGLASRLLMIWPEAVPPRTPRAVPDNKAALERFRRLLALTAGVDDSGRPYPMPLFLSPDAALRFAEWRTRHAESESEVAGPLLNHYGKMPGLALRLGLCLEHLWWSETPGAPEPTSISTKALVAALALVEQYLKPMAVRAYGDAGLPVAERHAATLGRWILKRRPDTINARILRRSIKLPGLRTAKDVAAAIDVAIEAGWLKPAPSREGGTIGRQREDYQVNPLVFQ